MFFSQMVKKRQLPAVFPFGFFVFFAVTPASAPLRAAGCRRAASKTFGSVLFAFLWPFSFCDCPLIFTIVLKAFTKMVNCSSAPTSPTRLIFLPRPLGGPRNAKRSSPLGKLTRGGLGKPLGRGEGVSPIRCSAFDVGCSMFHGSWGGGKPRHTVDAS
jgi:hypothetical protein